jgi:hypothetical protein
MFFLVICADLNKIYIWTELQISQITEFIYQYRKNWKEYFDKMSSDRIPKMILKYQPKGKRNIGRLLKDGRVQFCNTRNRSQ